MNCKYVVLKQCHPALSLPSSPICWGIYLLASWSPHSHVQHFHFPSPNPPLHGSWHHSLLSSSASAAPSSLTSSLCLPLIFPASWQRSSDAQEEVGRISLLVFFFHHSVSAALKTRLVAPASRQVAALHSDVFFLSSSVLTARVCRSPLSRAIIYEAGSADDWTTCI